MTLSSEPSRPDDGAPANSGGRLDRLPMSPFHWRILAFVGAGSFIDAFDIYLGGGVMAAMLQEGFSTLQSNAMFASATYSGMLIGAIFAGFVGDRYGRRYSYQLNLAIFGLASLAACLAPNVETLIAIRFIMGIGLGAEVVVAAGTLCEFIPPSHRGRWISLLGLIITSGLSAATLVGYFVIPNLGWRWMFGIAGVAAMVLWFLRKNMPESPRWLESVGRVREAESVLREIEQEVAARHGALPMSRAAAVPPQRIAPMRELFRADLIGRTVAACLLAVTVNISIYGFVVWLPVFLMGQGFTIVNSLGYTMLISFGGPAGALVGFFIADRISRRRALLSSAVAIVVLAAIFPILEDVRFVVVGGFALVTSIYTLVVIGMYGYIPELFPTSLRLRGTGLSGALGRAASIATPYFIVTLFTAYGISGVLTLLVGFLVALSSVILVLRVETGRGSLDDLSPTEGRAT